MTLDVPTLALVSVFVSLILGALMLFAWQQDRRMVALAWWGATFFCSGAAMMLLVSRGKIPDFFSIDAANALSSLGCGCLWMGARRFGGRRLNPAVLLVGPAVWLIAARMPFAGDINNRITIVSVILMTLMLLTISEFWRDRDEKLISRWPAIVLLTAQASSFGIRIVVVALTPFSHDPIVFRSGGFALVALGSVLYMITTAFILLAMTKERAELRHKQASLVDSLTGIANRRAFIGQAARVMRRHVGSGAPIAVLLFDLDRFKEVNDRFGHAIGDHVLRLFADIATERLRAGDLVGRLGGEEFAALLPGVDVEAACGIAEQIRAAFAEAADIVAGYRVKATVSVGVRVSAESASLEALIASADAALYRAKARGRNCVEAIGRGGKWAEPVQSASADAGQAIAHSPTPSALSA